MDRIRPSNQQSSSNRPSGGSNRSSGGSQQVSLSSKLMVVGIVLVGIAFAAALSIAAFTDDNPGVKDDQYQAVFLNNGQVYFGRLSNVNNSYVTLTDIYYLQVQQDGLQEGENSSAADPQISLAKLGNELHGPEDVMYISRDKVLFWENMKNDSDVVTAILNDTTQDDTVTPNDVTTQPAGDAVQQDDAAGDAVGPTTEDNE